MQQDCFRQHLCLEQMPATASKNNQAQPIHFFDLPFELRIEVFKYVFAKVVLELGYDRVSKQKTKPIFRHSTRHLLLTSTQIRHESYPLFYRNLAIITTWSCLPGTYELRNSRKIHEAFASARSITIHGMCHSSNDKLRRLSACQNLRELSLPLETAVVHVWPPVPVLHLRLGTVLRLRSDAIRHLKWHLRRLHIRKPFPDWEFTGISGIQDIHLAGEATCRRQKIWFRVHVNDRDGADTSRPATVASSMVSQ